MEIIFSMSWVIVNIETGEAVLETFNKDVILRLNTAKYKAVPIAEYLGCINGKDDLCCPECGSGSFLVTKDYMQCRGCWDVKEKP